MCAVAKQQPSSVARSQVIVLAAVAVARGLCKAYTIQSIQKVDMPKVVTENATGRTVGGRCGSNYSLFGQEYVSAYHLTDE